jgi:hypothetical protein
MCWNENVSLNTFVFSMFVLLLIIYNNKYTQYKITELNNIWVYIFFTSFISIQLVEFFIWKNINNKFYNHLFSLIGALIIFIQPVCSLMILSNISLRNILLATYLIPSIPYMIYKMLTKDIYTTISKGGKLRWHFFESSPLLVIIWIFYLLFSVVYEKYIMCILLGIGLLGVTYYNYKKDESYSSMWCWFVNSIMIYYAFYLLIVLPFYEKNSIC